MQTLTTEKAHSCCELRLPAWTCNDPARLLQFHTDDLFYSDPPSEEAIGRNALIRDLEELRRNQPGEVWTHDRKFHYGTTSSTNGECGRRRNTMRCDDLSWYFRMSKRATERWASCAQ
jgi:hypothetical protein